MLILAERLKNEDEPAKFYKSSTQKNNFLIKMYFLLL